MRKKTFHIVIIALMALNLMGSWGIASAADCGMSCCASNETAKNSIPVYEAPNCCSAGGMSCDLESTSHAELFDEVVCCFGQTLSSLSADIASSTSSSIFEGALSYHRFSPGGTPPSYSEPLFLKNLSILC